MRVILLIMIGLSVLNAEFTKNGDIVSYSVSGLEWQDDVVGSRMAWGAAISHCESLTLGAHSDWRLPNINELKSIVDRSKGNPAIVTEFTNTSSFHYWSSTTNEYSNGSSALFVDFSFSRVYTGGKGASSYVRCVRNGQ